MLWLSWPFGLFLALELKLPVVFLTVCPEGKWGKVWNEFGLRFYIRELVNGYKSFQSLSVYSQESWNPLLPGRNLAARRGLEEGRYLITG